MKKTVKVKDTLSIFNPYDVEEIVATRNKFLSKDARLLIKKLFVDNIAKVSVVAIYEVEDGKEPTVVSRADNECYEDRFAIGSMPHPYITRYNGHDRIMENIRTLKNPDSVIRGLIKTTKTVDFSNWADLTGIAEDLFDYRCIIVPGEEPMNGYEAINYFDIA